MKRMTGIALVLGAILFLAALFVPVTLKVYGEASNDAALQVQYISEARPSWQFASFLFVLGGVVAAAGLGMFAKETSEHADSDLLTWSSYGAAGLAVIGTLLWALVGYYRITLDPAQLGGNLNANSWMFPTYTVLMNVALIVFAVVMFRTKFPIWLTAVVAVFGAFQLGSFIATAESIPAVNYLPLLVLGIALIVRPVSARLET